MAEKGVLPATSGATPRAPNSAMSAFAKLLLKGAGAPSTQNRRSHPGGAEPTEVRAASVISIALNRSSEVVHPSARSEERDQFAGHAHHLRFTQLPQGDAR